MYGCCSSNIEGRLICMIEQRVPQMSTGTVHLSQRGVAVGMTLGVVAGAAWTVSIVVTLASWML
ncbi:hypothetical protein GCM10010518_07930 [Kitasatospora cinereorecta]